MDELTRILSAPGEHGDGLRAVAARVRARLREPFPREAVKRRQGGAGKMLDYIATYTVIHRLNDVCELGWDWKVDEVRVDPAPDGMTVTVWGTLTIPPLGSRGGTGVQKVSARGGEDLVKGASSDAMKKAATLFGVGIDLYGEDYEDHAAPDPASRPPMRVQSPDPAFPSQRRAAPPPDDDFGPGEEDPFDPYADDAPRPAGRTAAAGTPQCADCGRVLTKAQSDLSMRNYGQALCPNCQKNHARAAA